MAQLLAAATSVSKEERDNPLGGMKDAVEDYLYREVCRGTMVLAEAQRQIATDWLVVYRTRDLQSAP